MQREYIYARNSTRINIIDSNLNVIYVESWRQHQVDLNDLHGRIEAQTVMLADQTQRLQSADILVKDLYVENSHLTATVQRLEQQRARVNLIHQQQQHLVGANLSGLSGIP